MVVQRKAERNETEKYATVRSLYVFRGQVVNEMVGSEMKYIRMRRFCQSTAKMGIEGFSYRRVFCGVTC